jgi:ribosome hibernation promoting factor
MKVVFRDRTELGAPQLRSYAEKRMTRLTRHLEKVAVAEITFAPQSRRANGTDAEKAVKIIVHADGRKKPILSAEERGHDLRATLDLALDKVDRQVRVLKEKIVDRHRGRPLPGDDEEPPGRLEAMPDRVKQRVLPETVEEAAAALEANGHLFHLFLDDGTGELQVIYRRADGSLAVLEPIVK